MATETIVNDLSTTLDGAITSGATSLTLADATGAPNSPTRIRIDNEYILITARTGTSCTVTRGVEGTTPAAHTSGSTVTFVATNYYFLRNYPRAYNVMGYGALGDGRVVTDGAMTSGSAVLTSASGRFLSTDVGKKISVQGAGAAGAVLITTIAGYTSATQVTLTASASTTVSSKQAVWATNDSTAFQDAINAAYAAGGGTVFVPDGMYGINTGLTLKSGVTLRSLSQIAIDPGLVTGGIAAMSGPILLCRETGTNTITMNGSGMAISGLVFWLPDQVVPTAATPTAYPAVIGTGSSGLAGATVEHCTIVNAYDGIIMGTAYTAGLGRVTIQSCLIGAYHTSVELDHCYDTMSLHDCRLSTVWEYGYGTYPQTIDTWAEANSNGVVIRRADGVDISNCLIFRKLQGLVLTDSADGTLGVRGSYGTCVNTHIDNCTSDIVADSTNPEGWHFTNCSLHDKGGGTGTVMMNTGGTDTPRLRFANCSWTGSASNGVYHAKGTLHLVECHFYYGNATANVNVISTAAKLSMVDCVMDSGGGATAALTIANSWTGTAVIIGNDLGSQTFTPPATLPTVWRSRGNKGIPDSQDTMAARVTNSGVQVIGNAAATYITADTEAFDTDAIHSTSSNTSRLTVPTGGRGKWRISWGIYYAASAAGTYRLLYVQKNRATNLRLEYGIGNATFPTYYSGSTTYDLADGDYVELALQQDSGGNLNCQLDSFEMERLP